MSGNPQIANFLEKAKERIDRAAQERRERLAQLPPGTCEECMGTGVDPDAYGGRTPCRVCRPKLVYAVDVPVEFREARFSNYVLLDGSYEPALALCRTFVTESTRDLLIIGEVGNGKTRLAATTLNECQNARIGARFARVLGVLNRLLPGRMPDDVAGRYERELFTVPVLAMDDLGAEQASDYARRQLILIAEERHDRGLQTVWTSNKSLQQIAEMHDDDRLTSRLAGWADVVRLTGSDQRLVDGASR